MPKINLRMNPLIQKRLQMSEAGALTPLAGYLGSAESDENVRLYQDLAATSYIEIPREEILDVENAQSDKEPSVVFVKRDTSLHVHHAMAATPCSQSSGIQGDTGVMPAGDWPHIVPPRIVCDAVPIYEWTPVIDNVGHLIGYKVRIVGVRYENCRVVPG